MKTLLIAHINNENLYKWTELDYVPVEGARIAVRDISANFNIFPPFVVRSSLFWEVHKYLEVEGDINVINDKIQEVIIAHLKEVGWSTERSKKPSTP